MIVIGLLLVAPNNGTGTRLNVTNSSVENPLVRLNSNFNFHAASSRQSESLEEIFRNFTGSRHWRKTKGFAVAAEAGPTGRI